MAEDAIKLGANTQSVEATPRKRTRIQIRNEARILQAALDVFSSNGYRGSTVDQIADTAGMSKANILYYFNTKQDIHASVLAQTLTIWLNPLEELDADGDPIEELWKYTQQKLQLSRKAPHACLPTKSCMVRQLSSLVWSSN